MLVKLGGGVVDARGSMAGNTFSKSRFGHYIRARTKPVNPKSPRQTAVRAALMFLAEQWREDPMTDVIRGGWEIYANSVSWNNKLGEAVTLTGFNHFMRANIALFTASKAIKTAAPTDIGLPAADPTFTVTLCSAAAQTATWTFDDTMDWNDEDGSFLIVHMGIPQHPTRNFFGGPWRYWFNAPGEDPAGPVSPMAGVTDPPWPFIEGQKIWFKATIIRADGRMSTEFRAPPVLAIA